MVIVDGKRIAVDMIKEYDHHGTKMLSASGTGQCPFGTPVTRHAIGINLADGSSRRYIAETDWMQQSRPTPNDPFQWKVDMIVVSAGPIPRDRSQPLSSYIDN